MSRTAIAFTFVVGLLVVASGRWSGTAVWMSATFAEDAPARVVSPVTPKPVLFETHVRSILKAHCWQCHGDEEQPEGKLDLRLVRLMSAGGESGPAISPGQPDASLLFKRVLADEMPPGKKKVPAAEQAVLREWLAQGAKTARAEPDTVPSDSQWTEEERTHWAFQLVVKPPVPMVARPELVASPVDAFLLQRLSTVGWDQRRFAAPAHHDV